MNKLYSIFYRVIVIKYSHNLYDTKYSSFVNPSLLISWIMLLSGPMIDPTMLEPGVTL